MGSILIPKVSIVRTPTSGRKLKPLITLITKVSIREHEMPVAV